MTYQVMPDLAAEEYEALKADIAERGVMVPVEYDEHGNVLDGHHRLRACAELGIRDYPRVIRAGMTEDEKRFHARKLNSARRHLTREQKQQLVRDTIAENPLLSDRRIGLALSVDHKTVGVQREVLESTGEIPQLDATIGADGKERPRQRTEPELYYFALDDVYERNETRQRMVDDGLEPDTPFEAYPVLRKPHVAHNTGNNEWYTPAEYIEAARQVMGGIDLDPASCDVANQTVKAARYYSAEDDGLQQPWRGRVWMNPPYAAELIPRFADKLAEHVKAGDVTEAITLVNNATETSWFCTLVSVATAIVFPKSRVKFHMPDGKTGAPLQGQAILYCGNQPEVFMRVFSPFGWGAFL